MNERIETLAKAAGYDSITKDYMKALGFNLETFAELIIRECQDNLAWHGHDEAVSQLEWFKANKLGIGVK